MGDAAGSVDLYLRMSQDRSGEGAGRDRQETECRKLAATLGLAVRKVWADTESATTGARRPGFEAMLASAPEAIICWHEDRLIRVTRDLERVIALGINVHPVMSGRLDLSTPTGRAVARTVTAWAHYETEHKAERQRLANLQRAESGRPWTSGLRPFGFTEDRRGYNPPEAERVVQAFDTVLAGGSLRGILRTWHTEGVKTTLGNDWTIRSLRKILQRRDYCGRRIHNGADVGPIRDINGDPLPPLVDPETFAAVQSILSNPDRRTTQNTGRGPIHLLSGIAECGFPGCGLLTQTGSAAGGVYKPGSGHKRPRYRTIKCNSTGRHLERSAEPIEELVAAVVIAYLSRPSAASLFEVSAPDLTPLRARAAELRAQREALAGDLSVDLDFAAARDRRLREELERLDVEIAAKSAGSSLAPFATRDPGTVWSELDIDARRAVVRDVMRVVVLPIRQFGLQRAPLTDTVLITPRR